MSFRDRRRLIEENSRQARQRASELRDELRQLLLEGSPVDFYLQLQVLEALSRNAPADAAFGYDAAVEFLGGLVTSFPADDVIARLDAEHTPDQILRLDQVLRAYCAAEEEGSLRADAAPTDREAGVRALLRYERRLDRMRGYEPHLKRIVTTIFSAISDRVTAALGFSPTLTLRLAEAMEGIRERQWDEAEQALAFAANHLRGAPSDRLDAALAAASARFGAAPLSANLADELAAAIDVPHERVTAAVEALTTMVGTQSVDDLAAPNRLGRFPIIGVPGGRRAWPKPQDYLHTATGWLDQLLIERGETRLREAVHRARDKATETLTEEALASVFGVTTVHRGMEYQLPDGTWAETDIVVLLPDAALVVEAKAHAMTDPGRAGRPDRVERHLKDLLHKPLQQSQRTREALLRGTQWRHRGRPFTMPAIADVTRVVVTFEVVDPFVTLAHQVTGPDLSDAWVVSLSHLMMVTEILTHPVELFAYATTRAAVTAAGRPIVFMESDALAAWCRTREGVWNDLDGAIFQLAYQSDELNKYFTSHSLASKGYPVSTPPRPTAGIPNYILQAVDAAASTQIPWTRLCQLVAEVKPAEWTKIDRRVRAAGSDPARRRARKRARQAVRGIKVNDRLTVRVGESPGAAPVHDRYELCVLPPNTPGSANGPTS